MMFDLWIVTWTEDQNKISGNIEYKLNSVRFNGGSRGPVWRVRQAALILRTGWLSEGSLLSGMQRGLGGAWGVSIWHQAEEDGDLEFSHSQEYNLQINKSRGEEEEVRQENKVHKKENKHEAVAA